MQAGADGATQSGQSIGGLRIGGLRIGRRALAAAGAALVLAGRARADIALPPGDCIAFRILRDGSEVGSHRITFARRGDTITAQVAIDIAVSYAWITVYRFAHRANEIWQGGHFAGIESRTDDNGTAAWMRTETDPAGALLVSGSGTEPYAAPSGALATTYWNPAILRAAPVISSQDGRLSEQRVLTGALEAVPCASGTVQARRHEMRGDRDLEIWYDLDDQWAHMRFQRDGSLITYLRI
jgi:hypothetical protein